MAGGSERRKKYRGYRREFRRILNRVHQYTPRWSPSEEDPREEWLDLYGNSNFRPRGRDKKQLLSALLDRTREIMEARPAALPFCKVFLMVCEERLYDAEIILIYDPERFETFWDRGWERVPGESLLARLFLASPLEERGWRDPEDGEEFWFYGDGM